MIVFDLEYSCPRGNNESLDGVFGLITSNTCQGYVIIT